MKARTSVVVALLAATFWLVAPGTSQADYSDWCNDGAGPNEIEVPLLPAPVKLGVAVDPSSGLVQLCYSTAPAPVIGNLAGGVVQVIPHPASSGAGATVYIGCGKDAAAAFGASCSTETGAAVNPTYQQGVGQTYRVTLNYSLCPVSGCTSGSQLLADWTGVIVGTFGVLGPPTGTSTGASVYVDSFYACANGVCQRIDGIVGAGTNPGAVNVATSGNSLCVLSICQVVPTSESVAYDGDSLLTLNILGTPVPVHLPGGRQCIQKFGSTSNPPC